MGVVLLSDPDVENSYSRTTRYEDHFGHTAGSYNPANVSNAPERPSSIAQTVCYGEYVEVTCLLLVNTSYIVG